MAADKDLLISIRADDDGSAKVVRENTQAIQQMESASKSAGKQTQYLGKQTFGLRDGTKGANLAMMDLGRVVQDLPYGLRGVANNIDPLVSSLQRVKGQTGSWKGAVTALLGSLTGPAGIAIAVSTVTSILVSFGPQISEFFGVFEEGKKKIDEAKKSAEQFSDAIGSELDSSISDLDLEKQIEALENVRDQLNYDPETDKDILGDVDFSKVAQQAQQAQANAIMAGKAASDQYQASLDQIKTDTERNEKIDEIVKGRLAELEATKLAREELKKLGIEGKKNSEYAKDRLKSLEKANEQLRKFGVLSEENARKRSLAAETTVEADGLDTELPERRQLSFSEMAGATERQRTALARYNEELARSNSLTQEHADKLLLQYDASAALSQSINRLAVDGFAVLGETLGNILSADFEGNIFQNFQLLFADFMSNFGQQLIQLGLAKIALDKLFAFTGGGAVAVAAGVALVAAAQATRNSAQQDLNAISGGSGNSGPIGYRGLDFASDRGQGQGNGQGSIAERATGGNERESREIRIFDGLGNMVARGQEELDRGGGQGYVRGS